MSTHTITTCDRCNREASPHIPVSVPNGVKTEWDGNRNETMTLYEEIDLCTECAKAAFDLLLWKIPNVADPRNEMLRWLGIEVKGR